MPKRSCPFGESFPSQMKTHVGLREVAQGVDREKHMKDVYARTLALMSSAQQQAKKEANLKVLPQSAAAVANGDSHHPENGGMVGLAAANNHGCNSPQLELLPGQCRLDVYGRVADVYHPTPKNKLAKEEAPARCRVCCTPSVVQQCYSCENFLCTDCYRSCLQCEREFCNMCSLVDYEETFDRIFCLSCYSQLR